MTTTFLHPEEELVQLTTGQLLSAAMNVDVLYTAAVENNATENDRAYLKDQNRRLDAELVKRGLEPYGELED